MADPRRADAYFARALELEACARLLEAGPPLLKISPRWRDAAFLRREAEWWRAYARDLVETAPK
ncbi:MAG: hypothetical protein WAN43_16215 [Rhodomicrobium sp.]